jgi:XTP/dITP diphosphohydrolase
MMISKYEMDSTERIYLATTNAGKVREFREAAQGFSLQLEPLNRLFDLEPPVEDGRTFEENARIKAGYYSRFAPGSLLLAEDSGLSVDQLDGAPGVYSARYAAVLAGATATHKNSDDAANNMALMDQLKRLPEGSHSARYICVIAIARDGKTLAAFRGEVEGEVLASPRGRGGFGYDPLFFFPVLGKTFAELPREEKRRHSHRGQAFRGFLEWYAAGINSPGVLERGS